MLKYTLRKVLQPAQNDDTEFSVFTYFKQKHPNRTDIILNETNIITYPIITVRQYPIVIAVEYPGVLEVKNKDLVQVEADIIFETNTKLWALEHNSDFHKYVDNHLVFGNAKGPVAWFLDISQETNTPYDIVQCWKEGNYYQLHLLKTEIDPIILRKNVTEWVNDWVLKQLKE